VKCYIWSIALYGAETWTLRKADHKYLESSDIRYCRRMEQIIWTDRFKNEAVLQRVKEERNILHAIKRRKANLIGHVLRWNCLLKHCIEGKIEGTGRRGRCRFHSVASSLWKTLWTCRKTDCVMMGGFKSLSGDRLFKPDILVAFHGHSWRMLSQCLKWGYTCSLRQLPHSLMSDRTYIRLCVMW
jgi:hypothetical protein